MSVDTVTVGDAVIESQEHLRRKRLQAVATRPEPPGPRSVGLALARLGLVTGPESLPRLIYGDAGRELRTALRSLIAQGALVWSDVAGCWRPSAYGVELLGPDMRQRPFLTTR